MRRALLLVAILMVPASLAGATGKLHIVHCLMGCPTGAPTQNDTVVRQIYALSANPETKFADWVAYLVTRDTMGTAKSLNRTWATDSLLSEDATLAPKDYKDVYKELKSDRGHLAPLASFAGTVFWRDTNILSNIAPQRSDLNQGSWLDLETAVRNLAWKYHRVWVLTGPLYETEMRPMPKVPEAEHQVPSAFWKVVATESGRVEAFVFDQMLEKSASHCQQQVAITDLEARVSLDLFPRAPAGWTKQDLGSELGC